MIKSKSCNFSFRNCTLHKHTTKNCPLYSLFSAEFTRLKAGTLSAQPWNHRAWRDNMGHFSHPLSTTTQLFQEGGDVMRGGCLQSSLQPGGHPWVTYYEILPSRDDVQIIWRIPIHPSKSCLRVTVRFLRESTVAKNEPHFALKGSFLNLHTCTTNLFKSELLKPAHLHSLNRTGIKQWERSKVKYFTPWAFSLTKTNSFREQLKRDHQIAKATRFISSCYLLAFCSRPRLTANTSCVQTEQNTSDSGRTDTLRRQRLPRA